MKLWSISDLHIQDENDPLYEELLNLIDQQVGSSDVLVLAGDIFELFVGAPRFFKKKYTRFLELLQKKGSAGARIVFIEGNHDFHLKQALSDIKNLEVYPDEVALTFAHKKFYVAHGDLVDAKDHGYRALRRIFRSPIIKGVALALPGGAVDQIGQKASLLSQKSRSLFKKGQSTRTLSTERLPRIRNIFRSFAAEKIKEGFDFVLLGHCHDLDEMSFKVSDREGHYMNMGYPRVHRSCVVWTLGEPKLSRFYFQK